MPLQTFRYAVCGSSNMVLDLVLFYVSFNFIFRQNVVNLGFISLKGYNAALALSFCVTFPVGFLLSKFIVFNGSHLRGRIQLVRYMLIVGINLILNYIILNLLVQYLHFFPTIAKMFAIIIIVTFSYLSQKHYTFKSNSN
ncbi:MAG: GtrA family protein [Ginsengibacter sp.]